MNAALCGMTIYQILWYFILYSFAGWCTEVVYCAMSAHRLVNRGFINGPVCPVYGFGVLLVFAVVCLAMGGSVNALRNISIFMLFPIGIMMTTSVELLAGCLLDLAFHARWWDYSCEKFNFRGYICLKFSLLWGIGIVFLVKMVHPVIDRFSVSLLPRRVGIFIIGAACITYFADFIVSVLIMMKLNRELEELDQIQTEIRKVSDQLTRIVAGSSIAAEVIVDAGLARAGLVKEDTLSAVVAQAMNAGDVIDSAAFDAEFKETGVPKQAGALVEEDVKEALKERKDACTEEISQRVDSAFAVINGTKDAAYGAIAGCGADAFAVITGTKDAAACSIQQTRESLEKRLNSLKMRSAEISSAALSHSMFGPLRIIRAFPRMTHDKYSDALRTLRNIAGERFESDFKDSADDMAA